MTATEPQREVPAEGLAEGLHEPTPIRVVDFDLELPTPQIEADERYDTAWLVGRRAGVPQGIVEVDLSPGAPPVQRQIASLIARPAARTTPGWDRVDDSELPRISVVVPTIVARTEELARGLAGFDRLDYPDVEIILVDNRRFVPAEDPLPGLIADRPWVRVVRAARPGISAARNAGLEAATGTVVVFTDDDVRVDPGWLRSIGRRFVLEPGLDAITGLILPEELDTPAQLWFERYYGGFSGERTYEPITLQAGSGPVGRARVVARDVDGREIRRFAVYGVGAYGAGANMAFRHSTLVELGGFDLALGTGTPARGGEDLATLIDVLWNGGRVGYEPAAVVHHQHRRGYDELLRQLHGNGVGFTAMLTSLVLADPRHLIALAAQLPLAVWRMVGQSVDRLRAGASADAEDAGPRYPRELVTNELRGFPSGPLAYLRSRRSVRAWTRRHGAESERPGTDRTVSAAAEVGAR